MIDVKGLHAAYGSQVALAGVSMDVQSGELVALLGPSGCGKTTLLRTIAGLQRPTAGEIWLDGQRLCGEGKSVPAEARKLGFVFQDYALFPHMTAAANVGYGVPRIQRKKRAAEMLELVGLGELANRRPHELSGGQQQRVALARALAPNPKVILLDEPWAAVDPVQRQILRDELITILRETNSTGVLVTHERDEALAVADRLAVMRAGVIEQFAKPEEVYNRPTNGWVAGFVGTANLLPGTLKGDKVHTRLGSLSAAQVNGSQGTAVQALLRPESITLTPDPGGPATVTKATFNGHDFSYTVCLEGGEALHARCQPLQPISPGDRVTVAVRSSEVATFSTGA